MTAETTTYGRVWYAETLSPGSYRHRFSVRDLPAGTYFVKVPAGGKPAWVEKFLKR